MTNEPEIVTRERLQEISILSVDDSLANQMVKTIELFAGLLENIRLACFCTRSRRCKQCELGDKIAAALRRYRGE